MFPGRIFMSLAKLAAPVAVVALVMGGASVALADPGPNGHNTFGLCTAYFAGSDKGQEMKHQAPPFAALADAASSQNQTVEEYCAANGTHPGQGGQG
jgi:hypothetical protein